MKVSGYALRSYVAVKDLWYYKAVKCKAYIFNKVYMHYYVCHSNEVIHLFISCYFVFIEVTIKLQ